MALIAVTDAALHSFPATKRHGCSSASRGPQNIRFLCSFLPYQSVLNRCRYSFHLQPFLYVLKFNHDMVLDPL